MYIHICFKTRFFSLAISFSKLPIFRLVHSCILCTFACNSYLGFTRYYHA